jgi:hypothetical protein
MLPGILNQLGAESLTHLKKLANNVTSQFNPGAPDAGQDGDDDDVPGLLIQFIEYCRWEKFFDEYYLQNKEIRVFLVLKYILQIWWAISTIHQRMRQKCSISMCTIIIMDIVIMNMYTIMLMNMIMIMANMVVNIIMIIMNKFDLQSHYKTIGKFLLIFFDLTPIVDDG